MTKREIIQALLNNRSNVLITAWTTKNDLLYSLNLLKHFEYNENITSLQRNFSLEQGVCYIFIFSESVESPIEDLGEFQLNNEAVPFRVFLLRSLITNISIALYSENELRTEDNTCKVINSLDSFCSLQQVFVLTERTYHNAVDRIKNWRKNTNVPLCALVHDSTSRADDKKVDENSKILSLWKKEGIDARIFKTIDNDIILKSLSRIQDHMYDLDVEVKVLIERFKGFFPILVNQESIRKSLILAEGDVNKFARLAINEIRKGLNEEAMCFIKLVDISIPKWEEWLTRKLSNVNSADKLMSVVYNDFVNEIEKEAKKMFK